MVAKKTTPAKKKKPSKKKDKSLSKAIGGLASSLPEEVFNDPIPCNHPHLVPLEVSFIRITHPNGYKEQPKVEFYVGISLATAFRVRKYFCPECNKIIKAPNVYSEEN